MPKKDSISNFNLDDGVKLSDEEIRKRKEAKLKKEQKLSKNAE